MMEEDMAEDPNRDVNNRVGMANRDGYAGVNYRWRWVDAYSMKCQQPDGEWASNTTALVVINNPSTTGR